MKLAQRQLAQGTVIVVQGAVDASTAPRLRAALEEFEGERVTVDLSGVPFMDSSGLGVLVGGFKRTRTEGGSLQLAAPTPTVMRVLQLTRLDQILPVVAGV